MQNQDIVIVKVIILFGILFEGHHVEPDEQQYNTWRKVIITIAVNGSTNTIKLWSNGVYRKSISRGYNGVMNNYLGLNRHVNNTVTIGDLQYSMKELFVYNRVLTDDEIMLIFNSNN